LHNTGKHPKFLFIYLFIHDFTARNIDLIPQEKKKKNPAERGVDDLHLKK
jgi:hypothetical protein